MEGCRRFMVLMLSDVKFILNVLVNDMTVVALDRHLHRNIRVNPYLALSQTAGVDRIPVVLSEFNKLLVQCPIVFTRSEDLKTFECLALLGLEPQQNLFWHNDSWSGLYIPARLNCLPFVIPEGEAVPPFIGLDQNNPCCGVVGERLFDKHGKPTDYLIEKEMIVCELMDGVDEIKQWLVMLDELSLIAPLHLKLECSDGSIIEISDLYSIDERKLTALTNDKVQLLHERNWLSYLYYVLASNTQFYSLIERRNAYIKES